MPLRGASRLHRICAAEQRVFGVLRGGLLQGTEPPPTPGPRPGPSIRSTPRHGPSARVVPFVTVVQSAFRLPRAPSLSMRMPVRFVFVVIVNSIFDPLHSFCILRTSTSVRYPIALCKNRITLSAIFVLSFLAETVNIRCPPNTQTRARARRLHTRNSRRLPARLALRRFRGAARPLPAAGRAIQAPP